MNEIASFSYKSFISYIVSKDRSVDKQKADLLIIDKEMEQTALMAKNWQPQLNLQLDVQRQETAQTFTNLNQKLREKIGDLLQNIELVMKKNADLRHREHEQQRVSMTGAVPNQDDQQTQMDPELKKKSDELVRLQKVICKQ